MTLIFFCSHFFAMTLVKIYSPKPQMQAFRPVALSTIRTVEKPYLKGGLLFIRHSETKSEVFKLLLSAGIGRSTPRVEVHSLSNSAAFYSLGMMRLKITYVSPCVVFIL